MIKRLLLLIAACSCWHLDNTKLEWGEGSKKFTHTFCSVKFAHDICLSQSLLLPEDSFTVSIQSENLDRAVFILQSKTHFWSDEVIEFKKEDGEYRIHKVILICKVKRDLNGDFRRGRV